MRNRLQEAQPDQIVRKHPIGLFARLVVWFVFCVFRSLGWLGMIGCFALSIGCDWAAAIMRTSIGGGFAVCAWKRLLFSLCSEIDDVATDGETGRGQDDKLSLIHI